MFTGIVEELGTLEERQDGRFIFGAQKILEDVQVGDSILVNGTCLTVTTFDKSRWSADLSSETLKRTTLDTLAPGDPVNLERALQLSDRLGGHLVSGHVDGVGTIVSPVPDLEVELPTALARYVVEKGSVAVDGVSLTVVDAKDSAFTAAIIPITANHTTLGTKRVGDEVNIEVDQMARYAERIMAFSSVVSKS